MPLRNLQPSQLFISCDKLCRVRATVDTADPYSMTPIPVVSLADRIVITDGHTRAFAAWSWGWDKVPAVWDRDELDWEAYEICVAWCSREGIHTIADLEGRVVDKAAYQERWLDRCAAMHRRLNAERRDK
jgi:hypothetical protein